METSACFISKYVTSGINRFQLPPCCCQYVIRMINMMYTCVSANFIFVGKNTKNQIKGCAPGNIAVCGFCLGWNCTLCVKRNSFTSKSKTRSADRHWPQNSLIVVRAISGDLCSKKGPCGAISGISCCQIRSWQYLMSL